MTGNLAFNYISLLLQDVVDLLEQFFFCRIRGNVEVLVSFDHGGELAHFWSVEDIDWFVQVFGIGEFIADAEGWSCAFSDDKITFFQPVCVLGVDEVIPVSFLFMD